MAIRSDPSKHGLSCYPFLGVSNNPDQPARSVARRLSSLKLFGDGAAAVGDGAGWDYLTSTVASALSRAYEVEHHTRAYEPQ